MTTTNTARCFKVLLGGAETADGKLFDLLSYRDEGLFMQWEAFGAEQTGIFLNDFYLSPENVKADNDRQKYLFEQKVGEVYLRGWCEFVGSQGVGHISFGESGYVLRLDPWAPKYDISIAPGDAAGVYWVADGAIFEWDTESPKWKAAPWQNEQAVFAYQINWERDPITGDDIPHVGMRFEDRKKSSTWEPEERDFSLVMSSSNHMSIDSQEAPEQPERQTETIKSVFPAHASFQFDRFAFGFVGAYSDAKNRTYAVTGKTRDPFAGAYEMEDNSRLSIYGGKIYSDGEAPRSAFLRENRLICEPHAGHLEGAPAVLEFNHDRTVVTLGAVKGKRVQGTLAAPRTNPVPVGADSGELSVIGLIGMNPMARDADNGWYDSVGRLAMDDFYKILLNYMDSGLRQNFIAATPPDLSPEVRHIANDSPANAAFYKTLQVPYLTKALSMSTQQSAKLLNGQRASKKLKKGCAENDVYTRHADKLYKLHWMKKFPSMQQFLDDQKDPGTKEKKNTTIANMIGELRKQLNDRMVRMPDDADRKERWAAMIGELEGLQKWGQTQGVYWAARLYYHLIANWLPSLELKLKDGRLSQDVTQDIKNLSSIFSLLEGSGKNPDGLTFQMAFVDAVRAFQLGTVLPQYVDYGGDPDYFLQVLESVFEEFLKKHAKSTDAEIMKQVREIEELRGNQQLTKSFINTMQITVRLLGPSAAWSKIVTTFQMECSKMVGVTNFLMKAQVMSAAMGVAGFTMVLWKGEFSSLSEKDKVTFITLSAGVFASILFAIAKGIVRVTAMWKDIQGLWSGIKVFFGGQPGAQMINVSSRLSSNLAKWIARSREEAMALQQAGELGTMSKMFGRNLGEFTAQVLGAAMAIVTIIWSAIEISNTSDPMEVAMNSLMIAASGLQLICIVGGWAVAGFGVASTSVAALLSICGALAVAAAIAGIVIMIILMTRTQDPPDPIRDFGNSEAAGAGLQMSQQIEVDYFDIVPSKDGVSYDGIAFQLNSKYLKLKPGLQAEMGTLTHEADTLFFIDTDSNGTSLIFTRLVDGDRTVTVFLTAGEDGKVSAAQAATPPARDDKGELSPSAVEAYKKQVERQHWKCSCAGQANIYDRKEGERLIMSAAFKVESVGCPGKYLNVSGTKVELQSSQPDWKLSMEQIGPGQLAYYPNPFVVGTDTRDSTAIVSFSRCASAPRTWTVTPALPPEFELVREGDHEGKIRQKTGVAPTLAAERAYRVTVSNVIQGHTYSSQADIKIEVRAAPQWVAAFAAAWPALVEV